MRSQVVVDLLILGNSVKMLVDIFGDMLESIFWLDHVVGFAVTAAESNLRSD